MTKHTFKLDNNTSYRNGQGKVVTIVDINIVDGVPRFADTYGMEYREDGRESYDGKPSSFDLIEEVIELQVVGGLYLNRRGEEIEITRILTEDDSRYKYGQRFSDHVGRSYHPDGRYDLFQNENPLDLIMTIKEPPVRLEHDDNGMYRVEQVGECRFDVIQRSSGVIIASATGEVTAKRAANCINACAVVQRMQPSMPIYEPLVKDCGSPTGTHNFFLVRPRGIHRGHNKKFIPKTVQLIDDQLYAADNEIEPLTWSLNGDLMQGPTNDPYQANLEWLPLPYND